MFSQVMEKSHGQLRYTSPKNSYGHSKVFGEKAIRKVDGIYTILRTSWVFSSTGKNFLRTMLQLSETNQILKIVKDQVGGPTPAKEIAKACHSIANQLLIDPGKSGTYHFSGYPDVLGIALPTIFLINLTGK